MYFNSLSHIFCLNIMKKFLYIITIIAFLTTHSSAELFMTSDQARIDRGIPNITGANLKTHAFTKSVRKVLAIFEVAIKEGIN